MLENGLNGCRVASEDVSQLSELRMLEESSEVVDAHLTTT